MPISIHLRKEICISYSCSINPVMTILGGVPMMVATPPTLAEKAMPSIKQSAKFLSFLVNPSASLINNSITERAMGSITTVVAVLLIHILKEAVANMNPRITLSGVVPVRRIIFNAMRRCRLTFSKASAITKPPKNKKTIGLP